MVKRHPRKVYKYREWFPDLSLNRFTESILFKREIYFAKPEMFNDPFDVNVPPDYSSMTEDEWKQKIYETAEYALKNSPHRLDDIEQKRENHLCVFSSILTTHSHDADHLNIMMLTTRLNTIKAGQDNNYHDSDHPYIAVVRIIILMMLTTL